EAEREARARLDCIGRVRELRTEDRAVAPHQVSAGARAPLDARPFAVARRGERVVVPYATAVEEDLIADPELLTEEGELRVQRAELEVRDELDRRGVSSPRDAADAVRAAGHLPIVERPRVVEVVERDLAVEEIDHHTTGGDERTAEREVAGEHC